MRASSVAQPVQPSHPIRVLIVTGTAEALTTARITRAARAGSLSMEAPAPVLATFGTQQPMLISMISAPAAATTRAASAIMSGSAPKICAEIGCSSSVHSRKR